MRTSILAILALSGIACSPTPGPAAAGPPAAPRPAAAPAAPADPILGTLNGVEIRHSELGKDVIESMRDMENEMLQRRLHVLWTGFEQAIDERILAAEAAKRGVSVSALRSEEIDAKLQDTPEEEVRAFYERYKDRIGVPFEVAAPTLTKQMNAQRAEELEAKLVERLRGGAEVSYTLPTPDLPRLDIALEGNPVLGPEDARVTIVEFSDFQCPFCAEARDVITQLHEKYPTDVRVVYRDFPLSQHAQARPAAEAAVCAQEQQKFWPYHDLLFDNPQALFEEDLRRYAREVELDMEKFEACVASDRPGKAVTLDEAAAERYGVRGTPALFLNGIKLIGLLPLPLMQSLIENELAR